MSLELSILYRGDLSSCNYACEYCPFAKHWESPAELKADQEGLARFTRWVTSREQDHLGIFFTPWGEALVRQWYRAAVVELSHLPQVHKVAVQTNLSCSLDWLCESNTAKIGLWCTYHPSETKQSDFLRQCDRLERFGVRYSVGCVGLREHLAEIEQLRKRLPDHVYLWINAFKSQADYYDTALLESFTAIDELFPINNLRHASQDQPCRTGHTAITVDGQGNIRRCHFVDQVLGNLYQDHLQQILKPRLCPNTTCGCHIGYVHLERLNLDKTFGPGLLERIPAEAR